MAAGVDELFKRLTAGCSFRADHVVRKLDDKRKIARKRQANELDKELDFFGDLTTAGAEKSAKKKVKRREKESETDEEPISKKIEKIHDDFSDDSDTDDGDGTKLFSDSKAAIEMGSLAPKKKRDKKRKEKNAEVQRKEEINALRNHHRIYLSGDDVPELILEFNQLIDLYSMPRYVLANVRDQGYATPTPIQMQTIPLMMHRREVLACAPTGSGKTAAYVLPIIAQLKKPQKVGFRAVIISPTRELAQQIYRECSRLATGSGFHIHVLTKASASTTKFGPRSSKRFDILITTPNRLSFLLEQEPPAISLDNVQWLILDEADKLFEKGEGGFRDQIAPIYAACDRPDVRHALFSATVSNGIEEWCRAHLDNFVRVIIGQRNTATEAIKQRLVFVGQEEGKLIGIRDIIREGFKPPMLVFVQSKERAKDLFHELIYDGLNVDVVHADRTQSQRDNVVRSFRLGKIWILICTELMSRGIDFKGVNMVVNYDFPTTAVSYIHRIGRTGRAGRVGEAVSFFTEDDAPYLRSIVNVMKESGCDVPEWMLKLKAPNKRKRKRMAKTAPERTSIKTVSKYDLQKARKKREMIEASKRQKTKSS
ncbi:probable ATP-dependent RNA helicase DDX52 isoform X2 [Oscarella lobularis]|uniref:probable ATP-dependent RNA helicase DDX52 isoform X2 n=1 Tax=Oscarella lobularis TaxID=121494 RepID=UPI0033137606